MGKNVKLLSALLTTTILTMGSVWAGGSEDDLAREKPVSKRKVADAQLDSMAPAHCISAAKAQSPKGRWLAKFQQVESPTTVAGAFYSPSSAGSPGTAESHQEVLSAFADIAASIQYLPVDDAGWHQDKKIAVSGDSEDKAEVPLNPYLLSRVEGYRSVNIDPLKAGRELTELFVDSNETFNNLGVKAETTGRFGVAEYLYRIGDCLGDMTATMNLGHLSSRLGNHDLAIHCYEYLNEHGNAEAKTYLAKVYASLEEMTSSKAETILFEGAMRNEHACFHYANRLKAQNNLKDALKYYEQAIKGFSAQKDTYNAETARTNMADTFKALGKYDEAIAAYRQVLVVYPADEVPSYNLAEILEELGGVSNLQEAFRLLKLLPQESDVQTKVRAISKKLQRAKQA